ncbi:MAG TPA: MBL fold metallo-hydrolase [Ignavibacteria bacterium]|nr:MBL fold metallo-hydrolase [Ignavibacteria bacterium]
MKVIILGSGTSQGVPVIGCNCETCISSNPKDKRLRTSAYIEVDGLKLLIDTSIDFRQQMLKNKISDVDAVLYTHHHVDHINGMDDLRQITQKHDKFIDLYGNQTTVDEMKISFRYVFDEELIKYKSVPLVKFHVIKNKIFKIKDTEIIPIECLHGNLKIFGFRIKNFAYITDCSSISDEEAKKLTGLKVLVLNALRIRPHPTHLNLQEAIEISKKAKPKKTYFTHLTHDILHEKINSTLPKGIELAYDNLEFNI